jgi:hypothetical protein
MNGGFSNLHVLRVANSLCDGRATRRDLLQVLKTPRGNPEAVDAKTGHGLILKKPPLH